MPRAVPVPIEYLRTILSYSPVTGEFIRTVRTGPNVKVGAPAGTMKNGYCFIRLLGKKHPAHRIAWAHYYGEWPKSQIDHINGDPSDNRIANLRLATFAENCLNRKRYVNNSSGFKGVTWHKATGKWQARIWRDHEVRHLGWFDDPTIAARAYDAAAAELHGKFARLNRDAAS